MKRELPSGHTTYSYCDDECIVIEDKHCDIHYVCIRKEDALAIICDIAEEAGLSVDDMRKAFAQDD
jgi:hypothetical protein